MAAPLRDGGKQQRPAGDRFQMFVRFGEAHEQVPPVVDERDEARHELAAGQIAGGKASPAPLVLQFIEGIFAIGAIAVELGSCGDISIEHQPQTGHRVGVVDMAGAAPPGFLGL